MISAAATGKNLQTVFPSSTKKRGYEIRAVEPAELNDNQHAAFISLAEHRRAYRYGGRALRYRDLENLKPWQVAQLHAADSIARLDGNPLNVFMTIAYGATVPGAAAMSSTFQRGIKRMAQWLRDNGQHVAYVYVHENPGDGRPNSHLLIHVPKKLHRAFKAKATDWFDSLDGGVQVDPRNDTRRRHSRLQYMSKGADYLTCKRYGGHRATGGQGPINIKRSGISQCLAGRKS